MKGSGVGRILGSLKGEGTRAKAYRATGWTLFSVFSSNALRLASNMVLTRLLFPEAFGLMALVQIFLYALNTFSDFGIQTAIMQNKRGDDPDFLNTAWTLQIMRGFVLWLGACALAWPAVLIYKEPELMTLLPVAGLSIFLNGFRPTRIAQASRHLSYGRQTVISLGVQFVTLVLTAALAWWLQSVWALAFASVISSALNNLLIRRYMSGVSNRFCWEKESVRDILGFGKFIFLSTIATFLINMGDRAVLGAYVDTATLGIYAIALTLGSVPGMIVQMIAGKVLFPLYRIKPPSESKENQRNIFRARRILSGVGIGLCVVLAFVAVWLVDLLYDARYTTAGPMTILIALRAIPTNAFVGTQNVLLASGDSRSHFFLTATIAVLQTALAFVGVLTFGIAGAILAPGLAVLLSYPIRARLTAKYDSWDPVSELGYMVLGFVLTGIACALHWQEITALF